MLAPRTLSLALENRIDMGLNTITTQDLTRLQQGLALADLSSKCAAGESDDLKLLIARLGHVKVQMYRERGPHKRPHFHIEFKREYRASYTIDTLERIVGYMPKRYEEPVLEWARSVQPQLASCWNHLSADGEPLHLELEGAASP
jgi:hypothetical protein